MSLADARANVVEAVEAAGYKVHAYGQPKLVAPCVLVDENDDYVAEGDLLKGSHMKVTFDLFLMQPNRLTKETSVAMDNMIEKVLFNLGNWQLVPNSMQAHVLWQMDERTTVYLTKFSITQILELGGN